LNGKVLKAQGEKIMAGGADSNIEFTELGKFLVRLGFEERTIKRGRESVCYERDYRGSDGGGALFMMRGGPSRSACRRRLQTVASGGD
jgi:hypothetical protein